MNVKTKCFHGLDVETICQGQPDSGRSLAFNPTSQKMGRRESGEALNAFERTEMSLPLV